MIFEKSNLRKIQRKRREDEARDFRMVREYAFPYLLENSPIEPIEGYILSDRDNWGVYAEYIFQNVSEKPIRRLKLRLDFYYYQNIPFDYLEFTYCAENLSFGTISEKRKVLKKRQSEKRVFIEKGASFGKNVYIRLPDFYFNKMNAIIESVEYSDGEIEALEMNINRIGMPFESLDRVTQKTYNEVNIYKSRESVFPTKNIPQFGEVSWLCCCGYKNHVNDKKCFKCSRDKETVEKLLSESAIEEKKNELVSKAENVLFHDKTRFPQNKYLENKQDKEKKARAIEQSKEKLAEMEREKNKRHTLWAPKMLFITVIFYMICVLITCILLFADDGKDGESFLKMLRRIFEGDKSVFEFFGG